MVCSACPGRRLAGWPRATTHGPRPADGAPAILESLRPRRRRSNRDRFATRDPPHGPGVPFPAPRRSGAARPAAGDKPLPLSHRSVCGGPRASRSPRQPPGVLRGRSRSVSGATDARPGGGACGPSRAALKTYRKFSPLCRQAAVTDSLGCGSRFLRAIPLVLKHRVEERVTPGTVGEDMVSDAAFVLHAQPLRYSNGCGVVRPDGGGDAM